MPVRYMSILNTCAQSTFSSVGSKNALGFSAYTGPKVVIGLRPWYKFDKRSDTGSNIENIIPVILEWLSPI